jgi:hydroxymethylglutaryl-CoA reductase
VSSYSFDPAVLTGNVEQFLGVAQVPIGLAGPLLVNGEHAQGEFYVPLATAEGTLVASYNRGMRLVYEAGGVTTTIMDDRMQRAPGVPVPERARGAGVLRLGGREPRTDPRPRRGHHTRRQAGHRALHRRPHGLHALQARPPRRPARGSRRTTTRSSASSSSRTPS